MVMEGIHKEFKKFGLFACLAIEFNDFSVSAIANGIRKRRESYYIYTLFRFAREGIRG